MKQTHKKSLNLRKAVGAVALTAMSFAVMGQTFAVYVVGSTKAVGADMTTADWNAIMNTFNGVQKDEGNGWWGFGKAPAVTIDAAGAIAASTTVTAGTGLVATTGGVTIGTTLNSAAGFAALLGYDGTTSGLVATDVQGAIDEIVSSNTTAYVPYTGATGAVDLGAQNFTTTGTLGAGASTLGATGVASLTVTGQTTLNTSLNGILVATAGVISSDGAPLDVVNGGTGVATFGGDTTLLYTTAADSLASLAKGTANQMLSMNGTATGFTWVDGLNNSLTDGQIFVGNASNVATGVAMTGEATIINTGAITLDNDSVIGKLLTGYTAGAGTVAATDSILGAIQKLDGNIAAIAPTLQEVTTNGSTTTDTITVGGVTVSTGVTTLTPLAQAGGIVQTDGSGVLSSSVTLPATTVLADGVTATTQVATDDSTKVATTAFVQLVAANPKLGTLVCSVAGDIGNIGMNLAQTDITACVDDGAGAPITVYLSIFTN